MEQLLTLMEIYILGVEERLHSIIKGSVDMGIMNSYQQLRGLKGSLIKELKKFHVVDIIL